MGAVQGEPAAQVERLVTALVGTIIAGREPTGTRTSRRASTKVVGRSGTSTSAVTRPPWISG